MGRLLAETTWDCNTLRRKKTLSILAVTLGFALVGPPLPAAQAEPLPFEVAPMPRVVKPKKYKNVTITTLKRNKDLPLRGSRSGQVQVGRCVYPRRQPHGDRSGRHAAEVKE